MEQKWKMPEWMKQYADMIYVYGSPNQDVKIKSVEYSMNREFMARDCDDSCIRSKIEMLCKMKEQNLLK